MDTAGAARAIFAPANRCGTREALGRLVCSLRNPLPGPIPEPGLSRGPVGASPDSSPPKVCPEPTATPGAGHGHVRAAPKLLVHLLPHLSHSWMVPTMKPSVYLLLPFPVPPISAAGIPTCISKRRSLVHSVPSCPRHRTHPTRRPAPGHPALPRTPSQLFHSICPARDEQEPLSPHPAGQQLVSGARSRNPRSSCFIHSDCLTAILN